MVHERETQQHAEDSACGLGIVNNQDSELLSKIAETNVDVVLMDIYMPNAVVANAEIIKSQLRGSCLLAISFMNNEETILLAKSYGAVRLLDKTELANTLVPAIKECAQQLPKPQTA
jgi:DNA-binding NarL/FixJ family response regulator